MLNVNPPLGTATIGNTSIGIFVTFNEPVNPNTASVIISPEIKASVTVHPKRQQELVITPQTQWESGKTYTVTVKAGLLSSSGQSQLKNDLILTYTVRAVEYPELMPDGGI